MSWNEIISNANDAFDETFAESFVYAPPSGSPVNLSGIIGLIQTSQEEGAGGVQLVDRGTIDIAKSQASGIFAANFTGTITVNGTVFNIVHVDDDHLAQGRLMLHIFRVRPQEVGLGRRGG